MANFRALQWKVDTCLSQCLTHCGCHFRIIPTSLHYLTKQFSLCLSKVIHSCIYNLFFLKMCFFLLMMNILACCTIPRWILLCATVHLLPESQIGKHLLGQIIHHKFTPDNLLSADQKVFTYWLFCSKFRLELVGQYLALLDIAHQVLFLSEFVIL